MKMKKTGARKFRRKTIKNNQTFLVLCIVFTMGILSGSICARQSNTILSEKIRELAEAFISTNTSQSILENFISYASADTMFIIASAIFGLCLIGEPILWVLPYFRGLGLGVLTGYIYKSYNVKGFIYSLILIILPAVISCIAMLISCKESILTTREINQFIKHKKDADYTNMIKMFMLRNIILFSFIALSAVIGSILSYNFSEILNPLS